MKLYAICSEGVNGPEPLYDTSTGAPAVYTTKIDASSELEIINKETAGDYFIVEFETDYF